MMVSFFFQVSFIMSENWYQSVLQMELKTDLAILRGPLITVQLSTTHSTVESPTGIQPEV